MTYRSLLVHLDQDNRCAARTRDAIALAQAMQCHLVGLAPTGLVALPAAAGTAYSLAEFTALAQDMVRQQAAHAARLFRGACQAQKLVSFEAVVDEADPAASLLRHAHCSDLTVLSQPEPAASGLPAARALIAQVLLYSARPTLLLPNAGSFDRLGSRVLVAWDDSREAARAVSDALPMLRRAEHVMVVRWVPPGRARDLVARPNLDALHQWLMWQGVTSDIGIEASEIAVAESMQSRAIDMGADLIVMGADGHARRSGHVLGNTTRDMLAAMTLPLLLSH